MIKATLPSLVFMLTVIALSPLFASANTYREHDNIVTAPVTLTATYIPREMPNTGYLPVSSASFAFAAVMLFGVGLALTPYARKILASAGR